MPKLRAEVDVLWLDLLSAEAIIRNLSHIMDPSEEVRDTFA